VFSFIDVVGDTERPCSAAGGWRNGEAVLDAVVAVATDDRPFALGYKMPEALVVAAGVVEILVAAVACSRGYGIELAAGMAALAASSGRPQARHEAQCGA
jgi:hypothetical protein